MIFRRPKLYLITLKRAHSLLKIPKNSTTTSIISGEVVTHGSVVRPSRDEIQDAFRLAAKRHHPDLAIKAGGVAKNINKNSKSNNDDATKLFRECHDARELLLDHYVRRKFIPPEIIKSTKDYPIKWKDDSLFSIWKTWNHSRSFQMEAFLRLSVCLGLAIGTYYHDKGMPERRKRQIQRRDAQFSQFGPRPPRF